MTLELSGVGEGSAGAICAAPSELNRFGTHERYRSAWANLPNEVREVLFESICLKGGMTKTVLVVDDEAAIRENLKIFLEYEGFHVLSASNGQEALALLQSERPCCIILDLMMPVMTGAEFLDALRQDKEHRNTPVMVVSAWAHEETKRMARADNIQVLRKPIDADELLESVRRCAA